MKILIVEDEPLLADELELEVKKHFTNIENLWKVESVEDGLDFFQSHKEDDLPDLIFSDIHLTDGLSFEIYGNFNIKIPIIFCTAYDEYALEAFKVNGIDYILKPFDSVQIEAAINKLKSLKGTSVESVDYKKIHSVIREEIQSSRGSILVSKGDSIIPIPLRDIRLAFIDNSVTYIICADASKYHIEGTLDQLQRSLGQDYFRLNRQNVIHRKSIEKVSRYFGRKLLVHPRFSFDNKLVVSKENSPAFLKWLELT
jgi:DNA-binding LytR/AlgR family response regulator